MAFDPWPASLPQKLLIDGFVETMAESRLRSATDVGPGKVRKRSSAMSKPVQGKMFMTLTQVATMEAFINDTLKGGSLPFTMPHPRTGVTTSWRIAANMPSWVNDAGPYYDVLLDLEMIP